MDRPNLDVAIRSNARKVQFSTSYTTIQENILLNLTVNVVGMLERASFEHIIKRCNFNAYCQRVSIAAGKATQPCLCFRLCFQFNLI